MNNPTLTSSGNIPVRHKRKIGRNRTVKILKMVAIGALIVGAGAAPSPKMVAKMLRELLLSDSSENRRYVQHKIRDLKNRGYLERHGVKFAVSDKGSHVLSEEQIWDLRIPQPARWSEKWYLIMFDIPLPESTARKALNRILLGMGLIQYQQSVLVYPHPIKETVLHICRFYKIARYVSFASTDDIDGSDKLKKIFKLS